MTPIAAKHFHLVAARSEPTGKPGHRGAMQDQLVGMKSVLTEEQVMLDQHENGAGLSIEMLVEKLMRQNQAQTGA
ncbi:hypothetical protein GCM10010523_06350 [Paenarthrobacter ilicis]